MHHFTAIACGGACGALCRYGVNLACVRWFGTHASLGTFLANVAGCLLIGLLAGAGLAPGTLRHSAAVVGFLGAMTTFSSFGLETAAFLQNRQLGWALLYVGGNLMGGLVAVTGGIAWGRSLVG